MKVIYPIIIMILFIVGISCALFITQINCKQKLPLEWSALGKITNIQKNTEGVFPFKGDLYAYDIYTINNSYIFEWAKTENLSIGDIVEIKQVTNCGVGYVSKR